MRFSQPANLQDEVVAMFELYRDPLFRYVMSLGVSAQDGEEITQEVFLALFRHLRDGKPRENLRGWIFRVGHNLALKLRGRETAWSASVDEGLMERQPDPDPNPEELAMSGQKHARLWSVMRALPQRERACLSLMAEGFRYREIAEVLEMSLGAVAQSLERSLAKLRRASQEVRSAR